MSPQPVDDHGVHTPPQRGWLFAVAGLLAAVLLAGGYVQWRQLELVDTAASFQSDALGWTFSQLEVEQLRLRNQVFQSAGRLHLAPDAAAEAALQLRYDIFVSRVDLVDHERAARIMAVQPTYPSAMQQLRTFVAGADRYLGVTPAQPLDEAALNWMMTTIDSLGAPLHELSLGAAHLTSQRATERNSAVRQQNQLSLALMAFQFLLLSGLACIVLRQLNALTHRRHRLVVLAKRLDAARVEAETANRAKSTFLANMSHEIRTPFHGMLGMLSLLQDSRLTPSQASHLETARDAAHHLLQVLNDILDLSQLESGRLQVVPQTVDLPQLIAQVEALMRVQALGKGLGLHVVVATEVPRWVRADATRVKQILFNLLSNAIKFSNTGTITLDVACGWIAPAASATAPAGTTAEACIVFTLSDPGVGMSPATVEGLFQRLTPGSHSSPHQAAGIGLGLEISRDLARVMGGDITVDSELGVGSTFTASLPLAAVGAPLASDAQANPAEHAANRPLRVLVAEDHAVNRAYMEAVLDKLGHAAVFSADGGGAVNAVQEQPAGQEFDIVLMDLHMPGMDGFAAARAIRALAPPRGDVPIVALTADAFHASRERARESGMDGFLTKPAHLPQLREALARYGAGRSTPVPVPVPASEPPAQYGAAAAAATTATTAAPPASPAKPDETLDRSIVGDMIQTLSAAQYARLLSIFFGARNQTVNDMREAAGQASLDMVRNQAHGLKGAALSLGLRALASLAEQIPPSNADIGSDTAALGRWIDELDHQFSVTHAECVRLGCLDA